MYVQPLPGAIFEILKSATQTGVLTLADRYGLLAATLDEALDADERLAVDTLLRGVRKGNIRVLESAA